MISCELIFHVEYGESILKEKYLIHFSHVDLLLIT